MLFDVHLSFMDARSIFWEYVILAQSYRCSVDEELSLSFVKVRNNFLNHTVSYVVAQLLSSRDSRNNIDMHLTSELYFYFAFALCFSSSNNIKCFPPPPNHKPEPLHHTFWGIAIPSWSHCSSDLTSPFLASFSRHLLSFKAPYSWHQTAAF